MPAWHFGGVWPRAEPRRRAGQGRSRGITKPPLKRGRRKRRGR